MKKELSQAQDLMWTAFDTRSKAERIRLAKQALALSPECADAYVLLARESIKNAQERIAFLEEGVRAGRRALGNAYFKEDSGNFWGVLETRPYMRAVFALAEALYNDGQVEASLEHYRQLLKLNRSDNQGVRYILIPLLVSLEEYGEAEKLLKQYEDDSGVWLNYSKALLLFKKSGDTKAARDALYEAIKWNPVVVRYLLLKDYDARAPLPDTYSPGGEAEALIYVREWGGDWRKSKNILPWVVTCLVEPYADK